MKFRIKNNYNFTDIKTSKNLLAIDTETTGLRPWGDFEKMYIENGFYPARPFAYSFCDGDGNTDYDRLEVDPFSRKVIEPNRWIGRKRIQKVLQDKTILKIFHNANFDLHMFYFMGYRVEGPILDTLTLAHLVTGGTEKSYGLKELSEKYLDILKEDQKDLIDSVRKARNKGTEKGYAIADEKYFGKDFIKADYWLGDRELCKKYAVLDAERTMLLYLLFIEEINKPKNRNLKELFETETNLIPVVGRMERRGVKLFEKRLENLENFYENEASNRLHNAYKLGLPPGTNLSSSDQLGDFFYVSQKVPARYTETYNNKKGRYNYKLDAKTLEDIALQNPVAKDILEYRSCNYALTNFVKSYKRCKVIEGEDFIIHPSYRQNGPITGRFSASDPNMLNVSSEESANTLSETKFKAREVFGPRKNHLWYLPDYKQMEVWVFAVMSGEPTMLKILESGEDFHGSIAKQIWGEEEDFYEVHCRECGKNFNLKYYDSQKRKIIVRKLKCCILCGNANLGTLKKRSDVYRKIAKFIMFCRLYGGGILKIALLAGISYVEAEEFVNSYNERLPGVVKYQQRTINRIHEYGFLENPFGRKYYFDPKFAYKGVNYMIQGTCADLMKRVMVSLNSYFGNKSTYNHDVQMLLTIHDELIIEVPYKYHSKKLMRNIINIMQQDSKILNAPVPLPIDMEISTTVWSEKKKINLN